MDRPINLRLFLSFFIIASIFLVSVKINSATDLIKSGISLNTPSLGVRPVLAAAPPQEAPKEQKKEEKTPPTENSSAPAHQENDRTESEMELMKNLSTRREQLEGRAKTLDTREALIRVTEQRVDQKIKELETLKAQVQTLLNQASTAQQTQIENLIKIYETMKPKEAARIFETLDLPILMGVVQRMKPQKTAAIMAEMPPEKAKEITIAMTKQDQLPQLKSQ